MAGYSGTPLKTADLNQQRKNETTFSKCFPAEGSPYNRKIITTGIFKEPVAGRVMLRTLNLDGDGQADRVAHGGIHKAVYVYSTRTGIVSRIVSKS